MENASLQTYFTINDQNYGSLIRELLTDIEKSSHVPLSDELTDARQHFLGETIRKGGDLTDISSQIANLTSKELEAAAKKIPDKQAVGWCNNIVSLDENDRKAFSEAADKRDETARWNNIFKNGQDEKILYFEESTKYINDELKDYIEKHNTRAIELLKEAQEKNDTSFGKRREHILIQCDPDDPSYIYTCKLKLNESPPNWKEQGANWEARRSFGSFLQDSLEWELFDTFQRDVDKRKKKASSNSDVTSSSRYDSLNEVKLKDVANHLEVPVDLFDPDDLQIVVSRDAQKIGEMSTGQRWNSCMAKDGCNYRFVSADIRLGTLVAYLTHKNDPEARWPIARMLIKPYMNEETRELVLVPCNKIYGCVGSGNSTISNMFKQRVNSFVSEYNADKSGDFHLSNEQYADGQGQTVILHKQGASDERGWTAENTAEAILRYQYGALEEWLTELKSNSDLLAKGERGPHNENPADTIKKIKKNIQHIFDAKNKEIGLPRMFFREMKTSIGSKPEPEVILNAINDKDILARQDAFNALVKGDSAGWETIRKQWLNPHSSFLFSVSALATMKADPNNVSVAEKVCANELKNFFKNENGYYDYALSYNFEPVAGFIISQHPKVIDQDIARKIIDAVNECDPFRKEMKFVNALIDARPDLIKSELINSDFVKNLSQLAASRASGEALWVEKGLGNLLKLRPEFWDLSLNMVMAVGNDVSSAENFYDHEFFSRGMYKTFRGIIEGCPENKLPEFFDTVVKSTINEKNGTVRYDGITTLSEIAANRADYIRTGALNSPMNNLFAGLIHLAITDNYSAAQGHAVDTLQVLIEKFPYQINLETAKGIAKIEGAPICVDTLIDKRPNMMMAMSLSLIQETKSENEDKQQTARQTLRGLIASNEKYAHFLARNIAIKSVAGQNAVDRNKARDFLSYELLYENHNLADTVLSALEKTAAEGKVQDDSNLIHAIDRIHDYRPDLRNNTVKSLLENAITGCNEYDQNKAQKILDKIGSHQLLPITTEAIRPDSLSVIATTQTRRPSLA